MALFYRKFEMPYNGTTVNMNVMAVPRLTFSLAKSTIAARTVPWTEDAQLPKIPVFIDFVPQVDEIISYVKAGNSDIDPAVVDNLRGLDIARLLDDWNSPAIGAVIEGEFPYLRVKDTCMLSKDHLNLWLLMEVIFTVRKLSKQFKYEALNKLNTAISICGYMINRCIELEAVQTDLDVSVYLAFSKANGEYTSYVTVDGTNQETIDFFNGSDDEAIVTKMVNSISAYL